MAPKPKLTYFNVTALAEPIRFLLALGDIDFEDHRVDHADWPKVKDSMPFRQMPVLEIDGRTMWQASSICRFLAKRQGLAGADEYDQQHIDAIVDTINDLRVSVIEYKFLSEEPEKSRKKEILLKETIPSFFPRLEKIAKDNKGYFCNGQLSYADIYFAGLIPFLSTMMEMDLLDGYPTLKGILEKVHSLPRIKEWLKKRPKAIY